MQKPDTSEQVGEKYVHTGHPSIEELVAEQGTKFRVDPADLLSDFWLDEEPIEDLLKALHEWRGHDRSDRAAGRRS